MPVIQQVDPLSVASEAVGSYYDNKRSQDLQARAEAYQKARDARTDMEADRSYKLQEGEVADQHLKTQSDLASDELNRKIAAATEEYNEKFRPIQLELAGLQVKQAQGEILSQQDQHRLNALQVKAASVDLEIKQKYGLPAAKAALQQSQAEASVAQTNARFAPQQAAANLAATNASTAATNASAAETTYRMTHGVDDYHAPSGGGGGGRMSAADRAAAEYDDALGALSDNARQFYNMLYSTNNPPTRAQAMLALQASARGNKAYTPNDVKNLKTLINSHESQFVTPSEQAGQTRYEQRTATSDTRYARRSSEEAFKDIARGRGWNALSPELREKVRAGMVDGGMTVDQVLQQLEASSLPDDQKAAVHRALTGS